MRTKSGTFRCAAARPSQQCQTTPAPIANSGPFTAFALAETGRPLCGLTAAGSVSCWKTFDAPPSVVTPPEPLVSITAGSSACGVSATHVGYCWGIDYQAKKIGQ